MGHAEPAWGPALVNTLTGASTDQGLLQGQGWGQQAWPLWVPSPPEGGAGHRVTPQPLGSERDLALRLGSQTETWPCPAPVLNEVLHDGACRLGLSWWFGGLFTSWEGLAFTEPTGALPRPRPGQGARLVPGPGPGRFRTSPSCSPGLTSSPAGDSPAPPLSLPPPGLPQHLHPIRPLGHGPHAAAAGSGQQGRGLAGAAGPRAGVRQALEGAAATPVPGSQPDDTGTPSCPELWEGRGPSPGQTPCPEFPSLLWTGFHLREKKDLCPGVRKLGSRLASPRLAI